MRCWVHLWTLNCSCTLVCSSYSFANFGVNWEHNPCSCQMVLYAFQTVSKTSAVKINNRKGLKGSSVDRSNWLPNCHPAVHTGHCAYCSTPYDCGNWCIYKLSHCTYFIKCGLTIQKFCEIFEGFHFEVLTVIDTACPCVIFKTVHRHVTEIVSNIIFQEVYRPQRYFRRKDAAPEEEESRVQSTLLEYGYNQTVATPVLSAESVSYVQWR